MAILYTSFFFVYAVYAVINPFLQVMLRNLGYSYETVGVLLSIYEIAGIIGPLYLSRYVDKRGNMKGAVLLSNMMGIFGLALLVKSVSLPMTIIALVLMSFFLRSLLPILDTYATNSFNGDAQRYALLRSFGTVGFVFFSLLFVFLGIPDLTNNTNIGIYGLAICLIVFIPTLLWDSERKVRTKIVIPHEESEGPWFDTAFVIGLVIIAFSRLSMSAITAFFSLYLTEELKINAISLLNAIAAISEIGAMILAGFLIQKKKVLPIHLFFISGIGMFVRLLVYAFFPSFAGVLVAQILHSIGYGVFQPASIQFVARRVKRSHRAVGIAMFLSFGSGIPAVLGATLGGVVVGRYGYQMLFGSYSLFALVSVILCLVFWKVMIRPAIEEY